MKLKIKFLIAISLFSCLLTSKTTSKQLFDVLQKGPQTTHLVAHKQPRSLFDNNLDQLNTKKPSNEQQKYFDNMSFNQVEEKDVNKNHNKHNTEVQNKNTSTKNIKDASNTGATNKNTAQVNKKAEATEKKKESSNKATTKEKQSKGTKKNKNEVNKLKKKVNSLIELNQKLMNKLKKVGRAERNKKNFDNEIVNFIEKYDDDVSKLKKNIISSKNLVEDKLVKKDQEFKRLYEKTEDNFSHLQSKVQQVNKKVNEIKNEEIRKLKALQSNFNLKDLTVENKLDVDGIAFINKINTKSVDLGNIKLEAGKITFNNENSKIVIGKEVISVGNILKNIKIFNKLVEKCGEKFEKCKYVSEKELQEQEHKQEEILENLKELRSETVQILSKHKKLRRF